MRQNDLLKSISHRLDIVSADVKVNIQLSEQMKKALGSLQTYFFSKKNQRDFPTTYIILDSDAVLESTNNSDINDDDYKKYRHYMMIKGL